MSNIVPYAFAIFCLLAVVQMALGIRLHRQIRCRFAGRWPELGRPGRIFNSAGGSIAMIRWLGRRGYLESNDARFIRLCDFMRMFSALYLTAFAGMIVLVMYRAFR
jgi:hypothetical protein